MKLKHENASSFCFEGEVFLADKNGTFTMPADAAAAAKQFGFVDTGEADESTQEAPEAQAEVDVATEAESPAVEAAEAAAETPAEAHKGGKRK